VPDDFDVLARRVEHLEHGLVRQQFEERSEVDALRAGVDHHRFVGARHLDDAQDREIGGLAQKLGVDGHVRVLGKPRAGLGQSSRCRDEVHAEFISGVARLCRWS